MYEDIRAYFEDNKIPKFRFGQFENAIFKQFVKSFDEITVFPKKLREDLIVNCSFSSLELVDVCEAGDTFKFVLKSFDGHFIESVLMVHNDNRRTVCVSSQVFCALGCKFCATGANKFKRNLSVSEIVEQVLFVARFLKDKDESVTNVVFMGMGEPFLNYENVVESIKILNSENYFNIGARHITVSTAGIVPKIYEFADLGLQIRLAISLHASNDKLRSSLMPINDKYPLSELFKAVDYFSKKTNKRVSFEYVLIAGVNDSVLCAKELVELLGDRLSHVNLLVYNPHEFADFKRPSSDVVKKFKRVLDDAGVECSVRRSMGDDVSGACGQLAGKRE
jgi:23S rRNA (adenine2503-C2)-methyltransferase